MLNLNLVYNRLLNELICTFSLNVNNDPNVDNVKSIAAFFKEQNDQLDPKTIHLQEIGIFDFKDVSKKINNKPNFEIKGSFIKESLSLKEALENIYDYYTSTFVSTMFDVSLKDVASSKMVNTVYQRFKKELESSPSNTTKVQKIANCINEGFPATAFYKLLDDIFNFTRDTIIGMFTSRKKKLVKICDTRTNEGKMINETLGQFRNLIEEIIVQRNSGLIQFVPPFDDKCYKYFCQNNHCFNRLQDSYTNENSMTKILDVLLGNQWKSNSVISILCMVNLSLDVNNTNTVYRYKSV